MQESLSSSNANNLAMSIHGHCLSKWEKPEQKLVAVTNVQFKSTSSSLPFPYSFKVGQEDPPQFLHEMYKSGIYPWDLLFIQSHKDK